MRTEPTVAAHSPAHTHRPPPPGQVPRVLGTTCERSEAVLAASSPSNSCSVAVGSGAERPGPPPFRISDLEKFV